MRARFSGASRERAYSFGTGYDDGRQPWAGLVVPTPQPTPHLAAEYPIPTALSGPSGITKGPDGNLWFAESNAYKIGRVTVSGSITEFPLPQPRALSHGIADITAGPDGNLWFTQRWFERDCSGNCTSYEAGAVSKISTAGKLTHVDNIFGAPLGITAGPDGNIWLANSFADFGGQIIRIAPSGSSGFQTSSGYLDPGDIVTGADGNLWFTESCFDYVFHCADAIARITPSGVITEFPTPMSNSGPRGIAAGHDGNLWFAETSINKIGRITTTGIITEFDVPTAESGPIDVVAGPDGNLWFTENAPARSAELHSGARSRNICSRLPAIPRISR